MKHCNLSEILAYSYLIFGILWSIFIIIPEFGGIILDGIKGIIDTLKGRKELR